MAIDSEDRGSVPEMLMCEHCSSWPDLPCHICGAPPVNDEIMSRFEGDDWGDVPRSNEFVELYRRQLEASQPSRPLHEGKEAT